MYRFLNRKRKAVCRVWRESLHHSSWSWSERCSPLILLTELWMLRVFGFYYIFSEAFSSPQLACGRERQRSEVQLNRKIYAPSPLKKHQVEIWWAHINYMLSRKDTHSNFAAFCSLRSVWAWIYLLPNVLSVQTIFWIYLFVQFTKSYCCCLACVQVTPTPDEIWELKTFSPRSQNFNIAVKEPETSIAECEWL